MSEVWIDKQQVETDLGQFFATFKNDLNNFGSHVNQTFEAFVFVSTIFWYTQNGWKVTMKNPDPKSNCVRLKFSPTGRPDNYSYALCEKRKQKIQIRHNLRVATKYDQKSLKNPAKIAVDVAVIRNQNLSKFTTNHYVRNSSLITLGEAKHTTGFAELIASFIGLIHETLPDKLIDKRANDSSLKKAKHPSPFLYVSGFLNPAAKGLVETIESRGFDIEIFSFDNGFEHFGMRLSGMVQTRKQKIKRKNPNEIG